MSNSKGRGKRELNRIGLFRSTPHAGRGDGQARPCFRACFTCLRRLRFVGGQKKRKALFLCSTNSSLGICQRATRLQAHRLAQMIHKSSRAHHAPRRVKNLSNRQRGISPGPVLELAIVHGANNVGVDFPARGHDAHYLGCKQPGHALNLTVMYSDSSTNVKQQEHTLAQPNKHKGGEIEQNRGVTNRPTGQVFFFFFTRKRRNKVHVCIR